MLPSAGDGTEATGPAKQTLRQAIEACQWCASGRFLSCRHAAEDPAVCRAPQLASIADLLVTDRKSVV